MGFSETVQLKKPSASHVMCYPNIVHLESIQNKIYTLRLEDLHSLDISTAGKLIPSTWQSEARTLNPNADNSLPVGFLLSGGWAPLRL